MPHEIRHACLGCGGSCQGVLVSLLSEEEIARVRAAAARLGRADPVLPGPKPALRLEGGACNLLDENNRCSIYEDRPEICRQYPLVALRADGDLRFGIDPGCYTAIHTWRTGPSLEGGEALLRRSEMSEHDRAFERAFLTVCATEGCTLRRLAEALSNSDPLGLLDRFEQRLREVDLEKLLSGTAPSVRLSLAPLAARYQTPQPPSPWPTLDAPTEAYAVDAIRRMVYLRLSGSVPSLYGLALLSLMGAVLCALTRPDPDPYGRSLAAWLRVTRAPAFFGALLPDAESLKHLATG